MKANLVLTHSIMEVAEFQKGQSVMVITKNDKVEGVISSVDMNVCTFETDYSIDYLKDGKVWTMIGIPARAIEIAPATPE